MVEIRLVVLEIRKAEFGNFTVPVNNTLVYHMSSFVFLATDTLATVCIDTMNFYKLSWQNAVPYFLIFEPGMCRPVPHAPGFLKLLFQ